MTALEIAQPTVVAKDGKPSTNSRHVADYFGKQHKNVLQTISKLADEKPNWYGLNFQPVTYLDGKGEVRPSYDMTRDGFTVLSMGFTGTKALDFKIAYVEAFNRLEAALHARPVSLPTAERLQALEEKVKFHDMLMKISLIEPSKLAQTERRIDQVLNNDLIDRGRQILPKELPPKEENADLKEVRATFDALKGNVGMVAIGELVTACGRSDKTIRRRLKGAGLINRNGIVFANGPIDPKYGVKSNSHSERMSILIAAYNDAVRNGEVTIGDIASRIQRGLLTAKMWVIECDVLKFENGKVVPAIHSQGRRGVTR